LIINEIKHRQTDSLNQEAVEILRNSELLHMYERFPKGGKKIVNKAIRINQNGEPFCLHDFKELDKKYYKNLMFQLRKIGFIEVVEKTSFAYYKVKGFTLKHYWEKSAQNPTELSIRKDEVYKYLLENIDDLESPALHNIRLHFHVDYIHHFVKSALDKGIVNVQHIPQNNSFIIKPKFSWGNYFTVQILVTPKDLVQIIINNTFKPIAVDEDGIYDLCSKLGTIREYLSRFSNDIPQVSSWLFVRADFGRDSKRPIHRMFPEVQFRDISGALVRMYAKKWPDNQRRIRVEKNIKPEKDIQMIVEGVLSSEKIL